MLSRRALTVAAAAALVLPLFLAAPSHAQKPRVGGPCKQCHTPQDDMIRGTLVGMSNQFKTLQVAVGSFVWVVKYGDDTTVKGAEKLAAIPKDKEVGVVFSGGEKTPYATNVAVKPPAKVAPEKLVSLEEMKKFVAEGPEKGGFLLIDSRPKPRFLEGHLPHAISLQNDKFDELKSSLLPKDKNTLLIFYCGGVT